MIFRAIFTVFMHTIFSKNVLAELIAKQKQQRFEKRMARDELESATDRLDEKWRKLMQKGGIGNLMGTGKKTNENQLPDDYDTLVTF